MFFLEGGQKKNKVGGGRIIQLGSSPTGIVIVGTRMETSAWVFLPTGIGLIGTLIAPEHIGSLCQADIAFTEVDGLIRLEAKEEALQFFPYYYLKEPCTK